MMQTTYVILTFLLDTFQKVKKKADKINCIF